MLRRITFDLGPNRDFGKFERGEVKLRRMKRINGKVFFCENPRDRN